MTKRMFWIAAAALLCVSSAAAQYRTLSSDDKVKLEKLIGESKLIATEGIFLKAAVKNAPYSGEEVTQFDQTLGNGTRIHRESRVSIYRDSEGRVRRETPDSITIADPVAGVSYVLNPKTMTARKMSVSIVSHLSGPNQTMSLTVRQDGPTWTAEQEAVAGRRVEVGAVSGGVISHDAATAEKLHAEVKATAVARSLDVRVDSAPAGAEPKVFFYSAQSSEPMKVEKGNPLGQQIVEGVLCDGTGTEETIAAGAIGNDAPIRIASERWYSPELKTLVMSKRTDPRTGDETFRLTNLRRTEPAPELFQVPAGYQILGN